MSGVQADGPITQDAAYQNYLILLNNSVAQSSTLALHDYINSQGLYVASKDQQTPFQIWGDGTMLNGGDGVRIASDTAHMSQRSIQDVLDTGTTKITPDIIRSRFPTSATTEQGAMLPLEQWSDSMKSRAYTQFSTVHDLVLSAVNPRMGHVSADMSWFYLKVSRNGMEGYLGRGTNDWAVLADRGHAARLRTRVDTDGAVYYGTEDDKWLSVGTVGVNKGYIGLYGWKTTGYPAWSYDPASKQLISGLANGPLSVAEYSDGHLYCYGGSGYAPAQVDIEYVP